MMPQIGDTYQARSLSVPYNKSEIADEPKIGRNGGQINPEEDKNF